MCKQQQVIDSKQTKNNSRIEIYKDCMGNVSLYNSNSFQYGVVKLCGWHVDNVGNMVKARFLRLRMPEVIAF